MSFFNPSWDQPNPNTDNQPSDEPDTVIGAVPAVESQPADTAHTPDASDVTGTEDAGGEDKTTRTRVRAKRAGISRRDIARILTCDRTLTDNTTLGALMEQLAGNDRAQQIEQLLDGKWRDAAKALQAAHEDGNQITRTITLIQLIDRHPAQIRAMARICEALTGDGDAKWTGKEMDVAATIASHAPQLDMGAIKELL